MPTEDRRKGKLLPSPVTPSSTVCFQINIPNAVPYRAAFLGLINQLGDWYTWDHPTDGTVCIDCEEAAQLWRNAIFDATWSDDCEIEPMSCDDVADCIQNDEGVQNALALQIATNEQIADAIGGVIAGNPVVYDPIANAAVQGVYISDADMQAGISSTTDCEPDTLFGSITQIVDQLNTNNEDFLEIIEARTNIIERVSLLIAAIPIFETLPANEIVEFVDKLVSEILENYRGQYTTELRDTYRCDLFCLAKVTPDCELTFDMIVKYFEDRLGEAFSDEQLFIDITTYFITGTWTGTRVVDIMHLLQVGIWRVTSNWIGFRLRTLQTVGLLGANNPDPDWTILCEECAPPIEPFTIVMFDPADTPGGTYSGSSAGGRFTAEEGPGGLYRVAFQINEHGGCVRIKTWTLSAPPNFTSTYVCDADPKNTSYTVGLVSGAVTTGTCYGGVLFGRYGPFYIDVEFENDC